MHPINVQMLVHCYGSLEKSPQKISGRIVEIETFSMTEELRNRLRYLGHVPLAKSFQVTEIALSENTIDSLVVKEFKRKLSYSFYVYFYSLCVINNYSCSFRSS